MSIEDAIVTPQIPAISVSGNLLKSTSGSQLSTNSVDLKTIALNNENKLKAIGIQDSNTSVTKYLNVWTGTRAQYESLTFKNYTVVGSPTITSDGIASNFSNSNYLTGNGFTFNDLKDKSWEVTLTAEYDSSVTTIADDAVMLLLSNDYLSNGGGFALMRNKYIKILMDTGDNNGRDLEYFAWLPSGDGTITTKLSFDINTGTYTATFIDVNNSNSSYQWTPTSTNKQLYSIYANPTATFKIGEGSDGYSLLPINLESIKFYIEGSLAYQAFGIPDANTLYNIIDDTDVTLSLLELLYPVGSVYIGTMATCPLATLGIGTWSLVSAGRVLQGVGNGQTAGDTVEAGLPNITGNVGVFADGSEDTATSALSKGGGGSTGIVGSSGDLRRTIYLDASRSSSIYNNSDTVQPPAYLVNIWERTA